MVVTLRSVAAEAAKDMSEHLGTVVTCTYLGQKGKEGKEKVFREDPSQWRLKPQERCSEALVTFRWECPTLLSEPCDAE